MVIFGRTSALLLAMVLLLLSVSTVLVPACYEALRLPERSRCAKFTLAELPTAGRTSSGGGI
jgi:hypothetical protein